MILSLTAALGGVGQADEEQSQGREGIPPSPHSGQASEPGWQWGPKSNVDILPPRHARVETGRRQALPREDQVVGGQGPLSTPAGLIVKPAVLRPVGAFRMLRMLIVPTLTYYTELHGHCPRHFTFTIALDSHCSSALV